MAPNTPSEAIVRVWLEEYGLGRYCEQISNAGYNSMRFVLAAQEEDIRELASDISMEPGHEEVLVSAWVQVTAAQGDFQRSVRRNSSMTHSVSPIHGEREGLVPPASGAAVMKSYASSQLALSVDSEQTFPPSKPRATTEQNQHNEGRKGMSTSLKYKHGRRETSDEKLLRLFNETDADGDGTLDYQEIKKLCQNLGDRMSKAALREAFDRMDPDLTGEVGFEAFRSWRKLKTDMYRRDLRKNVRQVFEMVDESGDGMLDKEECATMMEKISEKFKGVDFDPPFSLEQDFALMDVQQRGAVSWDEFLEWFTDRTGDDEPDIPVLPEYMVRKVVENSGRAAVVHNPAKQQPSSKMGTHRSGMELWTLLKNRHVRSGSELWALLRLRLGMLVQLQKQWGTIGNLYQGKRENIFEDNTVPRFIRDPDSSFCAYWDLVQVCGKRHQVQCIHCFFVASDAHYV